MAKRPNLNQMMKQVQQMQAEMAKAQEAQERDSRGQRRRRHGHRQDERRAGAARAEIDPEAVDPEDVGCSRTWCELHAVNEAIRSRQELAASKMGQATGGWATWATWACRGSGRTIDGMSARLVRGACPHDCPDTCAMHVTVKDGSATP